MKVVKLGVLSLCLIFAVNCGEVLKTSRDFKVDPSKSYTQVALKDIMRNPEFYENIDVRFNAIFNKHFEEIWVPLFTPFSPTTHISFSCWPENVKLWKIEERKKAVHTFYMLKDSQYKGDLLSATRYSVVQIYGQVRSHYENIPWIEVYDVDLVQEPIISDESIRYLINGLDDAATLQKDAAVNNLNRAVNRGLTQDAEFETYMALAQMFNKLKDYVTALNYCDMALDLLPEDKVAIKLAEDLTTKIQNLPKEQPPKEGGALDVDPLKDTIRRKNEEITKLKQNVESLDKQLKEHQAKLQDSNLLVEALSKRQSELEQAKITLEKALAEREGSLQGVSTLTEKLKSQLDEQAQTIKQLTATQSELQNSLKETQAKIVDLDSRNKELITSLEQKDSRIRILEDQLKDLTQKAANSESSQDDLKRELSKRNEEFAKVSAEKQDIEGKIADAQKTISRLLEANKELDSKITEFNETVSQLSAENSGLRKQVEELTAKTKNLEQRQGTLEAEKQKIADELEAARKELASLNDSKTGLTASLEAAQQKVKDLETARTELESKIKSLSDLQDQNTKEIAKLKKEKEEVNNQLEDANEELGQVKSRLQKAQKEAQDLKKEYEDRIEKLGSSIDALRKERDELLKEKETE